MTLVWLILAPIAFAGFAVWFVQGAHRATELEGPAFAGLLRWIASERGLEVQGVTERSTGFVVEPGGARAVGRLDGIDVEIGARTVVSAGSVAMGLLMGTSRHGRRHASLEEPRLVIRLWADTLPTDLGLAAEGLGASVDRLVSGDDPQTGDPGFDAVARITGSPSSALARLDAEARDALIPALRAGWVLQGGSLEHVHRRYLVDEPDLRDDLDLGLSVARLLARPTPPLDLALTLRAERDPSPAVRARALAVLLRDHPDSRYVEQAVETALEGCPGALVDALEDTETAALAAAWRLAEEGDARHVAPLRAASKRSEDLARLCRRALDGIEGRLDPSVAGGLALASGGERGGLSEVEVDRRGAVSEAGRSDAS